jgi:PAS domain S-box-containing protein
MQKSPFFFRHLSLRWLLIVPFVVQIVSAVGLVAYLSYRVGQKSVAASVNHLMAETKEHVIEHLDSYLDIAQKVNQSNRDLIGSGLIDVNNFNKLGKLFWQQVTNYNFSYMNYGNLQKQFIGSGYVDGNLEIAEIKQPQLGTITSYRPDDQGNRLYPPVIVKQENPTNEDWYLKALEAKRPIWSSIYNWNGVPKELSISATAPVYDSSHKLLGILGIDLSLAKISQFLQQLTIGKSGKVFILERSGLLVANSTKQKPNKIINGKAHRIKLADIQDPFSQTVNKIVNQKLESLHQTKQTLNTKINIQDQDLFIQITPYRHQIGIDWLVIIAIPQSDYLADIEANNQRILILCGLTLFLSIAIGILIANGITRPIQSLSQASQLVAEGKQQVLSTENILVTELYILAESFNRMAADIRESSLRLQNALQVLNNHNQELQQFLNAIPVGIIIYQPDGIVIYCNPIAKELLGSHFTLGSRIDGLALNYEFYITGTDQPYPRDRRPIVHALQGKASHIDDLEMLKDNGRIALEVWETPVFDAHKMVSHAIIAFQDISQRQATLQERDRAEAALRKSETRFRRVFDSNIVGMMFANFNGQITDANDRFLEIIGYSREELQANRINWVQLTPPEYMPQDLATIEQLKLQGFIEPWEKAYYHKNGHPIAILLSVALLSPDDDNCVCLVIDISDRKKAEIQLEENNTELWRANRLKDEFLATMSHELRTPLNAILGMTEGLQEEIYGPINAKQRQSLQTVESSSTHLLSLITDILDFAKIGADKIELDCRPTAIAPLCHASLALIQAQASQKQIQVELKLPPNLPDVVIDERRIRQVLINLLSNAVKFTPKGGQITLEVRPFSPPQSFLRLAVMDTGIGIATENISKLFQPFVQLDGALNRQYEGTGLGLALVKRLVELHGGRVGVRSEVGQGSCFTVDLPCQDCLDWVPIPDALAEQSMTLSPSKSQKSSLILLAEDNEANLITISSYLTAKGFILLLARNGKEAIALSQSQKPDLILMDIQMPDLDGLEAIKQIRLDPNLAKIPIIALTALAMPSDRDRCLNAGANDYLSKPVKMKELVKAIHNLLES